MAPPPPPHSFPSKISAGAAMNSGKRKMTDVVGGAADQTPANNQLHFFSSLPSGLHFAPPSGPPADGGRQSQVQQILNAAAARPRKPFSFTSLLMADDDDDVDPLAADIRSQREQVNQIISLHTDILKQALGGQLEKNNWAIKRAADQRAQQKLKQKETELQIRSAQNTELAKEAEHYRKEAEGLQDKVDRLKQAAESLKTWLDKDHWAHQYGETDSSSSNEEPNNVARPIRLDCRACSRQLATVMMWPCRHVCICSSCEGAFRTCPVCRTLKKMSIEVIFPLD
ncbi:SBP (S-ribonuclease binding protein) family protein [Striga asiatica]|uniref:SBP (S-ribonuclease binding protein) family protein n=1 Tax=Striga asiatica TaxID=4170 RepID=A0A5A7QNJ1_STRAF|nr:SBP (S-ribonuclease binding protein) family protein [Striga asiatica]